MKNIISLFVLLATFVTRGQTVTEKDLLGKWDVFKVSTSGITVNLKEDGVSFTEEMEKMIKDSGEDIEAVKPMILTEMKESSLAGMKLAFKTGLKAEWTFNDVFNAFSYTIVEEDGKVYLAREDGGKMQISFEGGILSLVITDKVTCSFEKVK